MSKADWTHTSTREAEARPRASADLNAGTSDLALAFGRAQHEQRFDEPRTTGDSTEAHAELLGAVRAFVKARCTDGAPPERILATIKHVTRGVDEARSDRLQALILREFLASYYDGARSAEPAVHPPA